MRNYRQSVSIILGIWLFVATRVLKPCKLINAKHTVGHLHQPDVLEQGGEEDEEVVSGQGLPHAHPSAKTKRHKLVFLQQTPAPLKHLQKPLRPNKLAFKSL